MEESLENLNKICTFINENFDNHDILYGDNTYAHTSEYWTLVALKILQADKLIRYKLHYATTNLPDELRLHFRLWLEKQEHCELNASARQVLDKYTSFWLFKHDLITPNVKITISDELQVLVAQNLIVHEKYGKICFDSKNKIFYRARKDEAFEYMQPEHILGMCIEKPHLELQKLLLSIDNSEFDLIKQANVYFPEIPSELKLNLLQICIDKLELDIKPEQIINAKIMQSSLDLTLDQTLDLLKSYSFKITPLENINELPAL